MKRLELHKVEKNALQQHIFGTYISLRRGMGYIAVAFPVVLYLVGIAHDIPLQDSMSAYYWAPQGGDAPVRIWFIGGLFALGGFFYLYKGFSVGENIGLNIAAVFAIAVAYFPMPWGCKPHCPRLTAHGISAFSLFACLAYVTFLRSRDTLSLIGNPNLEAKYERWYWATSVVMLASPVTAIILRTIFVSENAYIYFLELAGIWAFALFWFIKSHEMQTSNADLKSLRGEIEF